MSSHCKGDGYSVSTLRDSIGLGDANCGAFQGRRPVTNGTQWHGYASLSVLAGFARGITEQYAAIWKRQFLRAPQCC